MGRKKKKEESEIIYHTPLGTAFIPPEYDLGPDLSEPIEVTSLDDSFKRYITGYPYQITTTSSGGTSITRSYYPSHSYPYDTWSTTLSGGYFDDVFEKQKKEELDKVEIREKDYSTKGIHAVVCDNLADLSVNGILRTLSAIKGKLMLDVNPAIIHTIECFMTPKVRTNIVNASKKLSMYGKTRPIVARFDEYGRRLPDEIEFGIANGVKLNIVDPEEYGEFYLELKATEAKGGVTSQESYLTFDDVNVIEDLPF